MTINHSNCDHESSRAARAKCRRLLAGGDAPASTKTVNMRGSGSGAPKSQTPRDRDKACDICGVERVEIMGTDPVSNRLIFVGEKCSYYLKRALDTVAVPW